MYRLNIIVVPFRCSEEQLHGDQTKYYVCNLQ